MSHYNVVLVELHLTKKRSIAEEAISKTAKVLEEADISEEKRDVIHREIGKFRESMKVTRETSAGRWRPRPPRPAAPLTLGLLPRPRPARRSARGPLSLAVGGAEAEAAAVSAPAMHTITSHAPPDTLPTQAICDSAIVGQRITFPIAAAP